MREIKFRAWDNDYKEWITTRIGMFIEDGDPIIYDRKAGDEDQLVFYNRPERHIEIQQFTGLRDKSGKEIYEGDIVKTHFKEGFDRLDSWPEKDEIGVITIPDNLFESAYILCRRDKCGIHRVSEVIGNIFENPELLEAAK